jgi:hypothetical protein
MEPKGQVSPDGRWFWDGQKWLTTLSPDGQWRWDGRSWVSAGAAPVHKPWVGGIWWIPGLRTGAAWKLPVVAVGFLLLLAGINSAVSQPPSRSAGQGVAQAPPSASPSAVTKAVSSPSVAVTSPSPSTVQAPSPSPKAPPSPSPKPAASPVAPPPPPPPPPPAPTTCGAPANPWGYNFCGGNLIYSPPSNFCSYFNCIASFWKSTLGYVDECNDGTYSHSGGRQGACSYHNGEMRPLYSR